MPDYSGHMTHEEWTQSQLSMLLSLCSSVLNKEIGALQGCLIIVGHGAGLDKDEDKDFATLYWIADECSDIPPASQRHLYSDELLSRHDDTWAEIEKAREPDILRACASIIERFKHTNLYPKED